MSDNNTIPQTFTNSELPVDTVYFMSADKDGKLQFPGKIDIASIDNIDGSNLKISNLNVNAFQEKGWNTGNFPTNATNAKWPSVVSSKGWFLGKVGTITFESLLIISLIRYLVRKGNNYIKEK